jgi:hypothetical protein
MFLLFLKKLCNMRPILLFILSLLFFTSCKNEVKKEHVSITETTAQLVQIMENPSEENSQLPRLFSNEEGLYFSWVTQNDSMAVMNYSVLKKGVWKPALEIIRGKDWFNNWADFPAIAENHGNILSSILQKSANGTYTYDIKLNLYNAENNTWKNNFILHNDGTQSEHGFASMLPWDDDQFFVTWLDGRETVGKGPGGGQMTLRGAFITSEGKIVNDVELDPRICDCCQTSAAKTANTILVAYRDRSEEEIRDISVTRLVDGSWTQPITIGNDNWKIPGCPVNGPSIDTYEHSVAIIWFTAASGEGDVKVAFSDNSGESFGPSYRIDTGSATGRVDIAMINDKDAAVLWMQPLGDDEVIYLMKINSQGYTGNPIIISKTSPERASGFPQLELLGDTLYFAWTSLSEESIPSIKMASYRVTDL